MENLIAPSGLKLGIFRCLKAGTNVGYPDQGTPQGGVASPLLALCTHQRQNNLMLYRARNDWQLFIKHKANDLQKAEDRDLALLLSQSIL